MSERNARHDLGLKFKLSHKSADHGGVRGGLEVGGAIDVI